MEKTITNPADHEWLGTANPDEEIGTEIQVGELTFVRTRIAAAETHEVFLADSDLPAAFVRLRGGVFRVYLFEGDKLSRPFFEKTAGDDGFGIFGDVNTRRRYLVESAAHILGALEDQKQAAA
ncbi:hypothetical protein [Leifsonia sp. Leaf264]|uniref:hypothetical protein n=1 Tax=Leifsonia sp. Leaf264 TaxID=1736314 RepID=UPI0009E77E00|nr:hypothetical protein [Leifsonia sp. Leaf264]